MKKFTEIEYQRPDFATLSQEINALINALKEAKDFASYLELCKKIITIQNELEELCDYADISNMRDLINPFYKDEMIYWNEYKPKYDLLFLPFYKLLLNSSYRDKLLNVIPSNFFTKIDYQLRITSEEVLELQQQENKLKSAFRELYKSKIIYDGEEQTMNYISSLLGVKEREVRKKAHDALNDYFYSKQDEYDNLLYELIKVRNQIAKKLGFANYVDYSLYKQQRFNYDYKDINAFRNNIATYITPLCKTLSELKKEELAIEEIEYYDTVFFNDMPIIKYQGEELLKELANSFKEADADLYKLFTEMLENGYIDLTGRENKVSFAITNYLTKTGLPVITGNFKNYYIDVKTTTHEMGHSYQKYCSSIEDKKHLVSALLKYPTMEIAEMFSFGMELIMMSHLENVFSPKDFHKYCFMKMYDLISTLPYICLVDEFQEQIYSAKDLKLEEIRKTWLSLAKKYHLEKSNSGHINLDEGGYFYRQSHIYLDPFYYIDYALSYFGAFALWDTNITDLDNFRKLGSVASYYSFKELIEKYNLPNPFASETVKSLAKKMEEKMLDYYRKTK